MATVTGLTADRMLEIEGQSVVSGHVSGDNLILVTHSGAEIDAGSVRGVMGPAGGAFIICTSSTRPTLTGGEAGKAIYETDTKLVRIWTGAAWRLQEKIVCTSASRPAMTSADEGVKIYETDSNLEFTWNGSAWVSPFNGLMPVGFEMTWPGDVGTIPSMFLVEDGSVKNRADYPDLFTVLGTKWNTGGETGAQFRLPNQRDRVVVGAGGTYPVGRYGGENTHILTASEMPNHNHTLHDPGHGHNIPDQSPGFAAGEWPAYVLGGPGWFMGGAVNNYTGIWIDAAGGGQAHNVMQAYTAKYVIIRAF